MGAGVALVTGASRGIGRAVALELARRGYEVVATMRDTAGSDSLVAEAAGLPGRLSVERLDVIERSSIRIPDGLTVLVNNAAVELGNRSIEDSPVDEWRESFETNVFGLVEATRRAIPTLRASGGGVICNMTTSALLLPMPFYGVYRASKAAVSSLSDSLRLELAQFGIRVVEIMPGPVDTDMLARSSEVPDAIESDPYRALAEKVGEVRSSMSEVKTPVEDAARAVVDAIEDDGGPMRYACDPFADGLLDTWRSQSDEDAARGMLAAFSLE
jgi:NAD(P)-dependent dehydrogenase (short-subunit alcohol dehydrogenase family)